MTRNAMDTLRISLCAIVLCACFTCTGCADETDNMLSKKGARRGHLAGAKLARANLIRANLAKEDLSGSDHTRAKLSGATLTGAC